MPIFERLDHFVVRRSPGGAAPNDPNVTDWHLTLVSTGTQIVAVARSRVEITVLEAALRPGRNGRYWPVEIELKEQSPHIDRIRIRDDREDLCVGTEPFSWDVPLVPLSPTAFGNNNLVVWGFFFHSDDGKCREAKATSLDLYTVVERAWRESAYLLVKVDEELRITSAVLAPVVSPR